MEDRAGICWKHGVVAFQEVDTVVSAVVEPSAVLLLRLWLQLLLVMGVLHGAMVTRHVRRKRLHLLHLLLHLVLHLLLHLMLHLLLHLVLHLVLHLLLHLMLLLHGLAAEFCVEVRGEILRQLIAEGSGKVLVQGHLRVREDYNFAEAVSHDYSVLIVDC